MAILQFTYIAIDSTGATNDFLPSARGQPGGACLLQVSMRVVITLL